MRLLHIRRRDMIDCEKARRNNIFVCMTLFADWSLNEAKKRGIGTEVHNRTENCQVFNSITPESADQIRGLIATETVDQIDAKVAFHLKNCSSIEMLHNEM
jgi:hypothetical protein